MQSAVHIPLLAIKYLKIQKKKNGDNPIKKT